MNNAAPLPYRKARRIAGFVIAAVVFMTGCNAASSLMRNHHSTTTAQSPTTSPVITLPPASTPTTDAPPATTVPAPAVPAATALVQGQPFYVNVPANCSTVGKIGLEPLPDPNCTPGALNPAVSQSNIQSTICVSGYTKTIRPPSSFTTKLKKQQMAAWGITGSTSNIEEDHLVSLELGGAPSDSRNLWPEVGGIPNVKDTLENKLNKLVCSGQLPLATAQQAIATNWVQAYQKYVGPLPASDPSTNSGISPSSN